ncbi:DUF4397 domain-containing protein [Phytohabitans rumicis]|uniref:DUF4397 domain-containing protein n=1 Tax=Phytohabitans rumicis TaxID=1076125 RepID=A0A6V8LD71_9ACTN|nr:DUF4397 domain-containing protein [Phytohabitans rumicis]GFJ92539.1 hypothetical protein Prum_061810 [Phytohabitans rumicis]
MTSNLRTLRRAAALTGAILIGAGFSAAAAAPASAASVGYVRLAHLSPDTPEVDVYLDDLTGSAKTQVFKGVGYGVLSAYLPLPAGRYAVSMRQEGAAASTPPVLTTDVSVVVGDAYTVAGVGRYADLGLRILDDDLSAPAAGKAKVRVVQASVRAPVLDVAAASGPTIANGVQFATTTDYREVQPGDWQVKLQPSGGDPTTAECSLAEGTVYSLLILDAKSGGLTTELRTDAKGGVVVPMGGVDTGGGGAAVGGTPYPLIVAGLAGVLLAASAAAGLVVLRRRHT